MKAIVLCGGLGTRLGELTLDTPKPLLQVANRPFLAHVLDQLLVAPGIDEIILAVSFNWKKVQAEIGNHWRDIRVSYSIEHQPLGTGGAIKQAMFQAGVTEALVANGDTLLKIDPMAVVQFAQIHNADIVLALTQIEDSSRFGRVSIDSNGKIYAFDEKKMGVSGLINSGIYYLKSSVFAQTEGASFSFEKDILSENISKILVYGMKVNAYFIDIGIPQDLARAELELLNLDNYKIYNK